MAIWETVFDHLSPTKVITMMERASEGDVKGLLETFTTSVVIGEIKDKVRGRNSDNTDDPDDDVD